MAGLLDFLDNPGAQGLLAAVAAGMAGARRGAPINAIGSGLLGGLQGYNTAQQNQLMLKKGQTSQQLTDLQLKQAQQADQDQQTVRDLASQYTRTPVQTGLMQGAQAGSVGPTTANLQRVQSAAPQFDQQGFISALTAKNPMLAIQMRAQMAKESPIDKINFKDITPESWQKYQQTGNPADLVVARKMELTPGGQVWNPYQAQPGQSYQDPNKLFSVGPDGKPVPNTALQNFELQKAKAGASKNVVSVNPSQNPFFQGIGQFGAKQFEDSTTKAQEAAKRIEQNNTIVQLLDSGNIIVGPGAEWKLAAGRALQSVGFNYDKDAIKNTEVLASQLANRTLSSIRSSGLGSSQGFTNQDREFLSNAVGGSISLTPATLRRLVDLDNKAAYATIAKHNAMVKPVEQAASMQGFPINFEVDSPEMYSRPTRANAAPQPNQSAGPKQGEVVDGYVFSGGDPSDPHNWAKVK